MLDNFFYQILLIRTNFKRFVMRLWFICYKIKYRLRTNTETLVILFRFYSFIYTVYNLFNVVMKKSFVNSNVDICTEKAFVKVKNLESQLVLSSDL